MRDVLPCPFCGQSKPRGNAWNGMGFQQCSHCGAGGPIAYSDEERSIAAWNRRADLPRPQDAARIAELEEENAKLRDEARELKRQLGGGCEANHGGDHTVIRQGRYSFCALCGESLRGVRFCHEPPAALAADNGAAE